MSPGVVIIIGDKLDGGTMGGRTTALVNGITIVGGGSTMVVGRSTSIGVVIIKGDSRGGGTM